MLVVLDGAPGSGKSTQLSRMHAGQHQPNDGIALFATAPKFLEVPPEAGGERAQALQVALGALADGRTVFCERWDYTVRAPDLVLLFGHSVAQPTAPWPWPAAPADRIAPMPAGHEGIVGGAIWTAMASRGLYGVCPCFAQAPA
jgi:hypothetical protein